MQRYSVGAQTWKASGVERGRDCAQPEVEEVGGEALAGCRGKKDLMVSITIHRHSQRNARETEFVAKLAKSDVD